ncbi:winged helix-turn-helix domain-containing protein [Rhizobium rhizogenes]|uniref:winged helix-turn-helix domain-containing protein n=1 Tax=Rhizobium rhizogenes TaxID=359 RepID=UPI0028690BEA|nr:winged helix-turn-helix domain-containing protein [Rhizobium rhizogenes]
MTEAECAERLGLSTEQFKIALPAAMQSGFPMKDPLFGDRRYWPAIRAWLDRRYGLGDDDSTLHGLPGLDGVENWKQNK